jgi:tRNA 5-methylaminomethyl-2-thiouridine biosynthesis bifunctional protein
VRRDEHQDNIDKLKQLLPALGQALGPMYAPFLANGDEEGRTPALHGWAAVRCTVPDRLPLVGAVREDRPGLYVLAGLGARGLTLSVLCGELLAAQIENPQLDPTQSNPLGLAEPALLKHLLANRLRCKQAG